MVDDSAITVYPIFLLVFDKPEILFCSGKLALTIKHARPHITWKFRND